MLSNLNLCTSLNLFLCGTEVELKTSAHIGLTNLDIDVGTLISASPIGDWAGKSSSTRCSLLRLGILPGSGPRVITTLLLIEVVEIIGVSLSRESK